MEKDTRHNPHFSAEGAVSKLERIKTATFEGLTAQTATIASGLEQLFLDGKIEIGQSELDTLMNDLIEATRYLAFKGGLLRKDGALTGLQEAITRDSIDLNARVSILAGINILDQMNRSPKLSLPDLLEVRSHLRLCSAAVGKFILSASAIPEIGQALRLSIHAEA